MSRYLLKTVAKDGTAHGRFRWPLVADTEVIAPDWDPKPKCGGGLHGALNGEGDGDLFSWDSTAVWIASEIPDDAKMVDLVGKVKVDRCIVRCVGDRSTVTAWLRERVPQAAIIGGTATAGVRGTATAGDYGNATAGDCGNATAGYCGNATAGVGGNATAGVRGTATAGDGGTATAGNRGTATAGNRGTATAGNYGTATAGDGGTITIRYWHDGRARLRVGYVGEDGIEPNVRYRLDEHNNFVKAEAPGVPS